MVNMISRGDGFNLGKSRGFKASGEYDVRLQFVAAEAVHGGKDHSRLEPYPRLGGRESNGTQAEDQLLKGSINRDGFLRFAI